MSARNQAILLKIIKEGEISQRKLQQEFNLSKRQLDYSINKINCLLIKHNLKPIVHKNKNYIIDSLVADYFSKNSNIKDIVMSPKERQNMIIILILTRNEPLSLNHFINNLKVSKNTILNDIKKTKYKIEKLSLSIKFSRMKGYQIIGSEWNKRYLLQMTINYLYDIYGFEIMLELIPNIKENVSIIKKELLKIEDNLQKKYTDEDYYPLLLFFSSVFIRIGQKKFIDNSWIKNYDEINQTDEFLEIKKIAKKYNINLNERYFLSIHLLGANSLNQVVLSNNIQIRLVNALWEFLNNFEYNSFIILPNKQNLLEKLVNHFRPAYYRIKYNFPITNVLYNEIADKYFSLNYFVSQSIAPLEKFFNNKISKNEIAFITIFIGGHLKQNSNNHLDQKVIRAVPVCPNGVSVSKILEINLKETFPEFLFYPSCSIREYKNFILPHDIVFSTIPIKSDKKVYVVNSILDNEAKQKLRNYVFRTFFHLDYQEINSNDIVNIVKKFTNILDMSGLKTSLKQLLTPKDNIQEIDHKLTLKKISYKNIILLKERLYWPKILNALAQPLITQKIINKDFLYKLHDEYDSQPGYVLLNQNIALIHLNPDIAKQFLGISFVISKPEINYNSTNVNFIALLTTPDKTQHLEFLYLIKYLSENIKYLDKLKSTDDNKEAAKIINKFITERSRI